MSNGMDFDIDQSSADRLNQGMSLGGGIELPFDAPVFWWLNGAPANRALASANPALYFGGWACNQEDLDEVKDERGGLPAGLVSTDIYTRESKTIQVYSSRMLIIAPIGFRQSWSGGNGQTQTRSIQWAPGLRQHIQVLALMGIRLDNGAYKSWGAVTLSCKGFQAAYLTSALKDWKKALERPRKEHAPQIPAWAFWMAVGTFGQNIDTKMVGKADAQSPVTPVNLYVPKEITLETMRKLYVGKDAVNEMADKLEDAAEWLGAWKARADHPAVAPGDDENYIPPEPAYEDEIPF